jgi:hypothetical protein
MLDIYVSEKDATGDWGPAVNLGATINTSFNEDTPFITRNDSILYFSSEGHNTMGGFDVFKSLRLGNVWKTPENLGYPINTTDDDKFFQPYNNGLNAYYSMSTDYKKREIFFIGIGVPAVEQLFEIKGTISLGDTALNTSDKYKIFLTDKNTGDTIKIGAPDINTGLYNFIVNPGSFKIIYTGVNYLSQSIDTALNQDNPSSVITLNVKLEREVPVVYEKINLNNIPIVNAIDTSMLIKNMKVNDVTDQNINDSDILYYTVQVSALHNPVDVSYFKNIADLKVMYNDVDKYYRYTSGRFKTREEAYSRRLELIKKGYPEEIFIKKVSK